MVDIALNAIIGVSIMFGLALFFSTITFKDAETFFIWLTIFCGFVVWGGLLPLWILVIELIILVLIIANNIKKGSVK